MRVFLYECVTGGGWTFEFPPSSSLLAEAGAMVRALAFDLGQIRDTDVVVLSDPRWPLIDVPGALVQPSEPPNGSSTLADVLRVASECDATLVIAPEFLRILSNYVEALERDGVRLLSPPSNYVDVASEKLLCHRNLEQAVRVPRTSEHRFAPHGVQLPPGFEYPVVLKPQDGCGSLGVQLLQSTNQLVDWSHYFSGGAIVQEYIPGLAASVALLCGPAGNYPLPACRQIMSGDGWFQYLGGTCPLDESLNARAQRLALRTFKTMPPATGYVGVDLILGEAEDGSQDYVIEINPRLTTSYVGLRALSETNLAEAMIDVVWGREPQLRWKPGQVRWSADGRVELFGV